MRISDWSSDVCSSDLWMPEQVRHDGCAERRVAPSAFELMHQLAHRAVDVAIAVAQFLDAADRVDHGRMVAPTELAADLGQRPRRQPFGEIHRDLARPRHHARAPGGEDRKSVVWGQSVAVRVERGGCRIVKKKTILTKYK